MSKRVREAGFPCTSCGKNTFVKDSRPVTGMAIRRRRQCVKCSFRFTTYESLKPMPYEFNLSDIIVRLENGKASARMVRP